MEANKLDFTFVKVEIEKLLKINQERINRLVKQEYDLDLNISKLAVNISLQKDLLMSMVAVHQLEKLEC